MVLDEVFFEESHQNLTRTFTTVLTQDGNSTEFLFEWDVTKCADRFVVVVDEEDVNWILIKSVCWSYFIQDNPNVNDEYKYFPSSKKLKKKKFWPPKRYLFGQRLLLFDLFLLLTSSRKKKGKLAKGYNVCWKIEGGDYNLKSCNRKDYKDVD